MRSELRLVLAIALLVPLAGAVGQPQGEQEPVGPNAEKSSEEGQAAPVPSVGVARMGVPAPVLQPSMPAPGMPPLVGGPLPGRVLQSAPVLSPAQHSIGTVGEGPNVTMPTGGKEIDTREIEEHTRVMDRLSMRLAEADKWAQIVVKLQANQSAGGGTAAPMTQSAFPNPLYSEEQIKKMNAGDFAVAKPRAVAKSPSNDFQVLRTMRRADGFIALVSFRHVEEEVKPKWHSGDLTVVEVTSSCVRFTVGKTEETRCLDEEE